MKEELESKILGTLKRLYNHSSLDFKYENLNNHQQILDEIKTCDVDILKSYQDVFILWDSYAFIRTDSMLMFKARDIWKMEMDTFVDSLIKSVDSLDLLLKDKGI